MLSVTEVFKNSKVSTASNLFLWFSLYSVFGWVWETIVVSIEYGYLVSRGFLFGPLCPIYGVGAVSAILLFGKRKLSIPIIFLAGAALVTILEYITSFTLELAFDQRWWDYTTHRFNIHGRVSLLATVVFGVMIVLLIKFIHPRVERLTERITDGTKRMLASLLAVAILLDLCATVVHLLVVSR